MRTMSHLNQSSKGHTQCKRIVNHDEHGKHG